MCVFYVINVNYMWHPMKSVYTYIVYMNGEEG